MEVPVYNAAGEAVNTIELSEAVFGHPMNEGLLHQALVRYMANQRQGTVNTLTRAKVSGGGKKPWREKGTGRARQGSTRAPHFRGGGVVFGPHPRDYRQDMPRKMRHLALMTALSERARTQGIRVLDELTIDAPKTREVVSLLDRLNIDGKALVITPETDQNVYLSTRNIQGAAATNVDRLNIAEIIGHDVLVLPVSAVRKLEEKFGQTAEG